LTCISLFDANARVDLRPASYGEPHFGYLNASARPEAEEVRSLLDRWFASYPESEQEELRSRFRASNDRLHYAAFFELYVHELLRRKGCSVQVHPVLDTTSRRPDFLVRHSMGAQFYTEVVVATDESQRQMGERSRLDDLKNALNSADSPNFFIHLDTEGVPTAPLPLRGIRQRVEQFLSSLDPDELSDMLAAGCELRNLPCLQLAYAGCKIEIRGIPKSVAARARPDIRPLGAISDGAKWVNDSQAVRDALVRKAGRYGKLDLPYLIAVNAPSQHLDRIDMMEALFGKEQFVVRPNEREPEMIREPNGLWTGPVGARYRRVSAVLMTSSLGPWNIGSATNQLFHNPWAHMSLGKSLDELPVAHPVTPEHRMQFMDGATNSEIFELPLGWPRSTHESEE
jgi:hypothetical protein